MSLSRVLRNPVVHPAGDGAAAASPRVKPSRHALSALLGDAEAEAYERGLAEGLARGRREADGAIRALAERIEAAVEGACREIRSRREAEVEQMVQTALDVAEFVIGHEPGCEASVLVDRIHAALTAVDDAPLTLSVSPVDRAAVAEAAADLAGLEVTEDPRLGPGEARITGPWATVDMTHAAILGAVREALS